MRAVTAVAVLLLGALPVAAIAGMVQTSVRVQLQIADVCEVAVTAGAVSVACKPATAPLVETLPDSAAGGGYVATVNF